MSFALRVEVREAQLGRFELGGVDQPVPDAFTLPHRVDAQARQIADLVDTATRIAGAKRLIDLWSPDQRAQRDGSNNLS